MKKSEKRPFVYMVLSIGFLLGIGLWWNRMNAEPVVNFPTTNLPEPNAYDYYVKASQSLKTLTAATPGWESVDPATDRNFAGNLSSQQLARKYPTAGKVAWLRKCAPTLKTLRQGFPLEYREPPMRSATAIFPHLAQYRALARLLLVESHARSEQGNWAGAANSALDAVEMGCDVQRGSSLISALVGYALGAIGRGGMRPVLAHLDAAQARAAARRLEGMEENRGSFADVLKEEKWFGQSALLEMMRSRDWRSLRSFAEEEGGSEISWQDVVRMHFYSKQTIVDNHARYMDALIARAATSYKAQQSTPMPALPSDPLNQRIGGVFERAQWNAARDATGNVTLMLQLALRAFELERGRLPETLSELTPNYLKKIPVDPFGGGEALRYRRTGKTYLLYSVGPDGKDDGGKPILRANATPGSNGHHLIEPDSKGDYVAGLNR